MSVLPVGKYVHNVCAVLAGGQKRVLDPMELEMDDCEPPDVGPGPELGFFTVSLAPVLFLTEAGATALVSWLASKPLGSACLCSPGPGYSCVRPHQDFMQLLAIWTAGALPTEPSPSPCTLLSIQGRGLLPQVKLLAVSPCSS